MTRNVLAFVLVATTSGAAWADKPVHSSATVEVLDDKAPIDDVISRMKKDQTQKGQNSDGKKDHDNGSSLRDDRPPTANGPSDTHRSLTPDVHNLPPGSRRPLRDNRNSERAEQPRPKRK